MSSRVSRADLLEFLQHEETAELDTVLDCFGYKRPLQQQFSHTNKAEEETTKPEPRKPPHEPPEPLTSERPPEVFYVVQGQETSSLLPPPTNPGQPDMPEWVESLKGAEAFTFERARKRFATEPPPHQPLASWSRLWPVLRSVLSQQYTRKRPDIPKLVKQVARAEQPRRIPQQQRQFWSSKVIILMDRPRRLDGLNQDYVALQEQLEKQRGDTGLECWFVSDLATGSMLVGNERKTWYPPSPETPILILSDLGVYERSGQATREWLLFGKKLRQAGCQAFALVPAPIRYLSDEMSQCFACISWDRYGSLKPVNPTATTSETVQRRLTKDQQKADELLVLASATTDIESDFLRSLRHQFTLDKPWHIGHELLVWNGEVTEQGSSAIVLGTKAQGEYRDRLARLLVDHPELAKPLYQHIRQQLAHTFTLDYVDALCFLGWLAKIEGDERLDEAEQYLKQYILFTHQQEQHKGLLFNGQLLLSRQDTGSLRQKQYYSSLWAIISNRTGSTAPRPDGIDHQAANAFLSQAITKIRVLLIQQGEWFYLGTAKTLQDELSVSGFVFNPYVLAEVDIEQDLVVAEYEGETTDHHLEEAAFLKWPIKGKSLVLHLDGQRLDVEALARPAWAGSFSCGSQGLDKPAIRPTGEDEYGVYFDWVIADSVTQRFRYIPPQTFLMGSPKNELGRGSDEIQHEVTIPHGYWLADTTVTQEFWETITGNNPSHFEGEKRPVEQVSWYDTQNFISRLKQHWTLLEIRLPSEAEWECACRAGTATAFSFGDNVGSNEVNYDINSPYIDGGYHYFRGNGSYREKTVEVQELRSNFWGLYQMHGNLLEWCQDEYAGYHMKRARELQGVSDELGQRVMRGGSWRSHGRYCRSACRFSSSPNRRVNRVGFRLALGHAN